MSIAVRFGAALAAALSCLLPAAAQAKWLRAESAHFILYSDSGEIEVRNNVRSLEEFDRLLRRWHIGKIDDSQAPKLEVFMVDGSSELRSVFPQMSRSVAGVYSARADGVFAIAFKPTLYGDVVVKHEYYHHFMLQNFPYGYPAWLTEGLAVYFSTAVKVSGKMVVGTSMEGQLSVLGERPWLPLDQILTKTYGQVRDVHLYYAQAWLLTNYMMADESRRKQLAAYVQAVAAGEGSVSAWTRAIGEAPEVTQKKLRSYVNHISDLTVPADAKQVAEVAITPMPASADDVLLDGQLLKHGVADERKAATLERIRAETAKYPDDRLANLVRVRAEIALGDPALAEPLLARLIAADGADTEARLLKGALRLRTGDAAKDAAERLAYYREAAAILAPALKANPRDYRLLHAYAVSRSLEPDFPSDNMLVVLANAVALAPQVASFRFFEAQALDRRGRYDEAIDVMGPIAKSPHGGDSAKRAEELIAEIQAHKTKTSAPAKP